MSYAHRVPPANATRVNVTQSTFHNIYEYHPRNLWLAYGIAMACFLARFLLSLRALYINGVAHNTSFFSVMATTRNSTLDEFTMGYSLGASSVPEAIQMTGLRFGELIVDFSKESESGVRNTALESETRELKKGQAVY
jgi:hypothetical protein